MADLELELVMEQQQGASKCSTAGGLGAAGGGSVASLISLIGTGEIPPGSAGSNESEKEQDAQISRSRDGWRFVSFSADAAGPAREAPREVPLEAAGASAARASALPRTPSQQTLM